jgi:hypothetical protein
MKLQTEHTADIPVNTNYFYIHGIQVSFTSDSSSFEDFVKKSMPYFLAETETKNEEVKYYLDINIRKNIKVDPAAYINGLEKIGNDAYLKGGIFVCLNGYYLMEFRKETKKLTINLYTIKGDSFYKKGRFLVRNIVYGEDYFFILRQSVIFPVFWALARYAAIYAMHGSAVNIKGKGIAFVGLAGIGKSTMSIGMTLCLDGSFLSDNYLLYDSNMLYSFPEWLRITKSTKQLLETKMDKLGASVLSRYGRSYYQLDKMYVSQPVEPQKIVFLRLGQEAMFSKLNLTTAVDRVLLSNSHVREFPEHSLPGLIDYLYSFESSYYESMLASLKSIFEKSDIYELTLPDNAQINKSLEMIMRIVDEGKIN